MKKTSTITIVGIGPGDLGNMTERAKEAILSSEVIVGYDTYVKLVKPLITTQEVISAAMTEEVLRAREAVNRARSGNSVAIISSGDAGLYGMAGLVYEVLIETGWNPGEKPEVVVIPGVTAMLSAASLLGAPLVHDVCSISLSDHLTGWDVIERRIEAAAKADFVIAIYNPKSGRRKQQIVEAVNILQTYRSADTPVGVVKSAYREKQNVVVTTLDKLLEQEIGMLTTIVIGNSTTRVYGDKMVTPRGYQKKYQLNSDEQQLQKNERMHPSNEPWALNSLVSNPEKNSIRESAEAALLKIHGQQFSSATSPGSKPDVAPQKHSLKEYFVSPGLVQKKFTAIQVRRISDLLGEDGEMEYTTDHSLLLRSRKEPGELRQSLNEVSLVVNDPNTLILFKACDFCDLQKQEPLPWLEELFRKLSNIQVPRQMKIGFNGCGMSCYGAVREDIGILFFRGKFEVYAGAKAQGRNLTMPTPIRKEMSGPEMVLEVESIVMDYVTNGDAGEKFYQFRKRTSQQTNSTTE
ncbi:MAG: precorrin-3B C(17)-methyltransferase [Leptospirales bacterium]